MAVNIKRGGRYRFELRCWPREIDFPIAEAYQDAEFIRDTATSAEISMVKTRVKVGDAETETAVKADAKSVVMELELEGGPARMQTWFTGKRGEERGACYVYVERC